MAENIFINVDELSGVIDKLKKLETRLNTIVSSQKRLTKDLETYWRGTSGEKVSNNLKEHNKALDSYLTSIKNEISFLEKTKEAYVKQTETTSSMIDENAKL